jgi:hypothetical protein
MMIGILHHLALRSGWIISRTSQLVWTYQSSNSSLFFEYRPAYQAVIFWQDTDTAAAFSRMVNGQVLTFAVDHEVLKDNETGSTWKVLDAATNGPVAGTQLTLVIATNHFWFSSSAFKPETGIYQP